MSAVTFHGFVPGIGGPDDVVLGEDGYLGVVVITHARIFVHAQMYVNLRNARPHLSRSK